MSSFAPSTTKERPEGPQKGPKGTQPSAGARRMGTYCPDLLVLKYIETFCLALYTKCMNLSYPWLDNYEKNYILF